MAGCSGQPCGWPLPFGGSSNPLQPAAYPIGTGSGDVSLLQKEPAMTALVHAFRFNESHTVRVQVIDGEPWFCLRDICIALSLSNNRKVVNQSLDSKGVTKGYTLTDGGKQQLLFVNEPNLYRVIFRSNKPEAKQFQDWVFNEVLPTIRKTGRYAVADLELKTTATPEQLDQIGTAVNKICSGWLLNGPLARKQVYNRLRVHFGIQEIGQLESVHVAEAIALLNSMDHIAKQFTCAVFDVREVFIKDVLGGGEPWTPSIKSALTKLKVQLPASPDWRLLAEKVKGDSHAA